MEVTETHDVEFAKYRADWNIRKSPTGTWRATRLGNPVSWAHLSAGLAETLMTDSAEALLEQLAEQERLAGEMA